MTKKNQKKTMIACFVFAFLYVILSIVYHRYMVSLNNTNKLLGIDQVYETNNLYMHFLVFIAILYQIFKESNVIRVFYWIITPIMIILMIVNHYHSPGFLKIMVFYMSMQSTFIVINKFKDPLFSE